MGRKKKDNRDLDDQAEEFTCEHVKKQEMGQLPSSALEQLLEGKEGIPLWNQLVYNACASFL